MTTQPNDKTPAPDGSTTDTQHLPALRPAPAQQREPESRVPGETTKTRRGRWFRYTLPGSWVALVFVCLSFTPSLLPRSWLLQAIVCGINGSIGYGLGVVGASVWRAFADRDPRPARRRSWAIFFVTAVVALPLAAAVGQWWQRQLRELMGVPSEFTGLVLLLPVVAAAVFVGTLAVSRSLRSAYRWISRLLGQWIGLCAARVLGWAIVLTTTVMVVNGVIVDGLASMADRSFALRDALTKEGSVRPTNPLRSGGPTSLVPWGSLGREGRAFVGTGPNAQAITAVTGKSAAEPIRAYAGTSSASDVETRAEVAAADLARA